MYSKRFTEKNPGLIVFLVDQSGSTEDIMPDGYTVAEHIADLVNTCITEAIIQATKQISDDDERVKHEVCFVIIGYGGKGNPCDEKDEGNWKAELLMAPKYSDIINDEYTRQRSSVSKCDNILQILTPAHGGGTPMASAYMTAYNVLKQWNQSHDGAEDPVPVIINISDGEPTDNTEDLRKTIEDIKSLQIADGSPLVINLHISAKPNAKELKTPSDIEDCYDDYSKLMFEISTEVTDDMINNSEPMQKIGISKGGRLFCSNIIDTAYAGKFLNIGTLQKMK